MLMITNIILLVLKILSRLERVKYTLTNIAYRIFVKYG